jgi:hypothetical protein
LHRILLENTRIFIKEIQGLWTVIWQKFTHQIVDLNFEIVTRKTCKAILLLFDPFLAIEKI